MNKDSVRFLLWVLLTVDEDWTLSEAIEQLEISKSTLSRWILKLEAMDILHAYKESGSKEYYYSLKEPPELIRFVERIRAEYEAQPVAVPTKVEDTPTSVEPIGIMSTKTVEDLYKEKRQRYAGQLKKLGGEEVFKLPWATWSSFGKPNLIEKYAGCPAGYVEAKPLILSAPQEFLDSMRVDAEGDLSFTVDSSLWLGLEKYLITLSYFTWHTCPKCNKLRLRTQFSVLGDVIYEGTFTDVEYAWHCKPCATRDGARIRDKFWTENNRIANAIRTALIQGDPLALQKLQLEIRAECLTYGLTVK